MNLIASNYSCYLTPVVGIGAGCVVKAAYHRSFYSNASTHELGVFQHFSNGCEASRFKISNIRQFIGLVSLMEGLPLALAIIEEVGKLWMTSQMDPKSCLWYGSVTCLKVLSFSTLHSVTILGVAILVGTLLKKYVPRIIKNIDPSGHAVIVCWNTAMRQYSLSLLQDLGIHSYSFIALTAFISFSEGIWLYDTTVNYHSIADMVVGFAIAFFALQGSSFVFGYAGTQLVRVLKPVIFGS